MNSKLPPYPSHERTWTKTRFNRGFPSRSRIGQILCYLAPPVPPAAACAAFFSSSFFCARVSTCCYPISLIPHTFCFALRISASLKRYIVYQNHDHIRIDLFERNLRLLSFLESSSALLWFPLCRRHLLLCFLTILFSLVTS